MTTRRFPRWLRFALPLALAGGGGALLAQGVGGNNSPIDRSGTFQVGGITVDVTADSSEAARQQGWRIAQRKGWSALSRRLTGHDGSLPDSTLDSIVSGIVIEHEEVGPDRYIARLGVLFSRDKAGSILGVTTTSDRSPPMLVVPLMWSGGAGTTFERDTAWQEAWNRFRSGGSNIDYVRPSGTGPDPLLLNAGQVARRGRGWWRSTLDQYGAKDVLIPQVRLRREWPGGPIMATFIAGHGPDNREIARFRLRVESGEGLTALMDEGVRRINAAYEGALSNGVLKTDKLLAFNPPEPEDEKADEESAEAEDAAATAEANAAEAAASASASGNVTTVNVQFATPSASAVTGGEAAMRSVPGVRSAATSSLALGGMSVMQVGYSGSASALGAALKARGWQVQANGNTLRIQRAAPSSPSPSPSASSSAGPSAGAPSGG